MLRLQGRSATQTAATPGYRPFPPAECIPPQPTLGTHQQCCGTRRTLLPSRPASAFSAPPPDLHRGRPEGACVSEERAILPTSATTTALLPAWSAGDLLPNLPP